MIPTRLRLLSANAEAGADDGWADRLSDLRAAVSLAKPSVIALQGASRAEVMEAARALEGFSLANGQRRWREGASHAVLLVQRDVVEVLRAVDVPLGDGSGAEVACMATIRPVDRERKLIVASAAVDLDAQRKRLDECGSIVRAMEAESADPRIGRVLMGTFREAPDQAIYRLLTGRRTHRGVTGGFRDTYRMVNRSEPAGSGWVVGDEVIRADWIMASSAEVQDARLIEPVADGTSRWAALGHSPVYAELLL